MRTARLSLPWPCHPHNPWRVHGEQEIPGGSAFIRKPPVGEFIDKPGRLTVTARISRSLETLGISRSRRLEAVNQSRILGRIGLLIR